MTDAKLVRVMSRHPNLYIDLFRRIFPSRVYREMLRAGRRCPITDFYKPYGGPDVLGAVVAILGPQQRARLIAALVEDRLRGKL